MYCVCYNNVERCINKGSMCLCRKYKVGRVNIDENHALQSRFGVKYLPMVLLVNKGDTYLYSGMPYCVISILFGEYTL
jgi:hypothetical protein